jgi:tetratricopeptide (TPR) repeat protein
LWALTVTAALAAVAPARADRIRTQAGIGYDGKIVGMDAGGLVLEYAGGKRTVPLADIASIRVNQYPDVEKAEEAYARGLAGGPKAAQSLADAERLYEGLGQRGPPPWLRVLVDSRMYKVYARSGRTQEALDAYLALAENQPTLVAGLKLPSPRSDDATGNRELLKKVEAALKSVADKPYAGELKQFRLALAIQVGKPEEVLPLLEPFLTSDNPKTRAWAMLKQLDLLFATHKIDEAEQCLNQAAGVLAQDHPQEVAFYTGRVLAERGQHVSAALQFMRVPILYAGEDRTRTAEALWCAGVAMKAAKMPDGEISKVLNEAVQNYPGTVGAERAKQELSRLEAPKG